jgi:hypothetical protein
VKMLTGRKTASADAAFAYLEKTPPDVLVYAMAEAANPKAMNKIRNYLSKWRPLSQALPGVANELELLGMARGPKFDTVVADFFQLQLLGRARAPEDRVKILRKLSGIKEPKKPEEKKPDEKLKRKLMGKKGTAPSPAAAAQTVKSGKARGAQAAPPRVAEKTAPSHAPRPTKSPAKPAEKSRAKR